MTDIQRRFAIGAEPLGERGTHFRVWAPACARLEVVERSHDGGAGPGHALERDAQGYFAGFVPELRAGALYGFRLDGQPELLPDPASRFQPAGPHGPSQIIDGTRYPWKTSFAGPPELGQVLYELHVGTFTREGTYRALARELPELAATGITTLELMPVAEFPGRFGWGYDGVALFAPTRLYGTPDELRELVDAAHACGLAVILDVVYNHLGPDGNHLERFSPAYFTERYPNEWGKALNFDGPDSGPVREFFAENARYWIEEFHFDGLRLDATQTMLDSSPRHVLVDITESARAGARAQGRRIFIAAESETQVTQLARDPEQGGLGCDAIWNDDFHHSARVALTGRREAYYTDYLGSAAELLAAIRWGFLYQGQHYLWQQRRRGHAALELEAHRFVTYLENHDQVANSLRGRRLPELTSPDAYRAMTALWLLAPGTPLLFQGQEFGATTPFLFFADHQGSLGVSVRKGRYDFMRQFASVAHAGADEQLDDPTEPATFERCRLDRRERERLAPLRALYRDLLALRKSDPAFGAQRADRLHGACLGPAALVLRYFCDAGDRLVVANFGADRVLAPAPEPLLAPPAGHTWRLILSSEDTRYGGEGFRPPCVDGRWELTARATSALRAEAT